MPALVSILIPAYNAGRWVRETISSALSQTWPKKEIVVVDDGSTDNTPEVLRSLKSPLVRIISQENRGACAARNRALAAAQGDYIQWLDADDLLAPDKIARQLKEKEDGTKSKVLLSSGYGRFYYRPENARFLPSSLWQDALPVQWFLRKFNDDVSMIPTTWLVSRNLTEQVGAWDERLTLDDDGEYFARIVAACDRIKFAPEAKCFYRQANSGSISRTINHKACHSLFLSYSLCIGYLLALEDSERTRSASFQYLQNNLIYFFPEEKELLGKINDLAAQLGGKLSPPALSGKYYLIRKILGWQTAKNTAFRLRSFKESVFRACDRFMVQQRQ